MKLTTAARKKLPRNAFAGPDRSYPIEDAPRTRGTRSPESARTARRGSKRRCARRLSGDIQRLGESRMTSPHPKWMCECGRLNWMSPCPGCGRDAPHFKPTMDDLARTWGATDWAECSAAIREGWAWCANLQGETRLVWRGSGLNISVESWWKSRFENESNARD